MRTGQTEPSVPLMYGYELPEGNYQALMMPPGHEYYELGVRVTRSYDFYVAGNAYSTRPYGTYESRRIEALQDAARREVGVFCEIAKMELGGTCWMRRSSVMPLTASTGAKIAAISICVVCWPCSCATAANRSSPLL
jgi:hypothetical protein